jgi:leucyl/phenylalanyl-tRNA--protein transferase
MKQYTSGADMGAEPAPLYCIATHSLANQFPNPALALREPDGLLAAGGDLSVRRLLDAYRRGIFPWYEHGQPILWWSPDPRTVIYPEELEISRSLRRTLKKNRFDVSFDRAFRDVIDACAEPRRRGRGTWITEEIRDAYCELYAAGHAHSVECWRDGSLVGGVYGIAIGCVFFGESMFSRVTDASKVGLVKLVEQLRVWGYGLLDCQVHSEHLQRLGAMRLPRVDFLQELAHWLPQSPRPDAWRSIHE